MRLTTASEALLGPARQTLRSFELAQGAVRGVAEGGFGRLALIANTFRAVEPLAGIIGDFRRLHPAVQLTVADPAGRFDVVEQVRAGTCEFGLVDGVPPAGPLDSAPARRPPTPRRAAAAVAARRPLGALGGPHPGSDR